MKARDEGLVECHSDLDNLENENSTLKGMKAILEDDDTKPAGGTAGTPRGPPPRVDGSAGTDKKKRYNKLPLINTRISEMRVRPLSRSAGSGWDQQEGVSSKKGAS